MKDLKKEREYLKINVQTLNNEEDSLMKYILAYEAGSKMEIIRKQVVEYARLHGNKAAKEKFECHRNTVSKFKNRQKKEGDEGLKDKSRAPHNIPHKITDQRVIDKICTARDNTGYGSFRLKMEYGLYPSNMAINRILTENGKIEEPCTKSKQKQDLWHVKQAYKTLETKLQLDAKNLLDIPNYLFYYRLLGLPKWQFCLRDVKSGASFISYASTEDGPRAGAFMVYAFEHFKRHGIDPSTLRIQTDGASYAFNSRSFKITAFRKLIENVYGAKLNVIPKAGTCQSDVESFNSLCEREFFKRQSFDSIEDFYLKAYKYNYHFNFLRMNRHKDWKAPVYYLNQDRPTTPVEVLDLPPIDLDKHLDLYWSKLNPKHVPAWESRLLDMFPEDLPCKDFSHNEYLDNFVKRVIKGYNMDRLSAHDLPIPPIPIKNKVKKCHLTPTRAMFALLSTSFL